MLLVLFCLGVGIPVTVALTPAQELVAFGQHVSVGARAPSLSIAGPAQLVQVGNTALDVDRVQVYGPLRPRIVLGPVQRNAAAAAVFDPQAGPPARAAAVDAVADGFVAWYVWAGVGLVAFTGAAAAAAGGLRTLLVLRRHGRPGAAVSAPADLWAYCRGAALRMGAVSVAVSVLAWFAAGALAVSGAAGGLQDVRSLTQLVGAYHVPPAPSGPPVTGYQGAVIGDSRAVRVGGPPLAAASPGDLACTRSSDSLAAEIERLQPSRVLNLACPGATVTSGLRGPQDRGGAIVAAQVGVLQQVQGLRFVVVAIGPNDLGWVDFVRYCYGVDECGDRLTQGEFDYRLAAFDRVYGDLLADLGGLPGRPQVIVTASYDVFGPAAGLVGCPDARGPGDVPGLDAAKVALLATRNAALNEVLVAGAAKYGIAVARPALRPLCPAPAGDLGDGLGPDIQGLADPHPFHPTGVGSLRMAAAVAQLVEPPRSR
ncbi:MAG: GDSL-type esterase/lipase family protein [Pseudonocardia sp.]